MTKTPAKKQSTGKRGGLRSTSWKKGIPSPNPKGAPKRGESWEELIKKVGDMTAPEAAEMSLELAKDYLKLGDGITLKQAVVMSVFRALLHDPQPGLFNAVMERAEGKITQPVALQDWREKLKRDGLDPDDALNQVIETVTPKLLEPPATLPLDAALQEAETTDVPQSTDH